ncbi:MAG: redoxin domain-containing protein [Candidatus Hydrogenedentes bacterium]|nr:redoxin domain-containing protein [Candidatus Hydrogenedentota bacterium]
MLVSRTITTLLLLTAPVFAEVEIGAPIPNIAFVDPSHHYRNLDSLGAPKLYVLAFITNSCPVAQRYLPRIDALCKEYAPQGVQFLAVNVGPGDSVLDMAAHAQDYAIAMPMVKDPTGDAVRALGITRTPEIAILDQNRVLRYRGRVDDQYRLGGVKPAIGRHDLKEAIDELLAGKPVSVPATRADGCSVTDPALFIPDRPITWWKDVRPLFEAHCVTCHQEGGSAPFSLTTLESALPHTEAIVRAVRDGAMPPWSAAGEPGIFHGDRRLSNEAWRTIQLWVLKGTEAGTPPEDTEVPAPPSALGAFAPPPNTIAMHRVADAAPGDILEGLPRFELPIETGTLSGDGMRGIQFGPGGVPGARGLILYHRTAESGEVTPLFSHVDLRAPLHFPEEAALIFDSGDTLGVALIPRTARPEPLPEAVQLSYWPAAPNAPQLFIAPLQTALESTRDPARGAAPAGARLAFLFCAASSRLRGYALQMGQSSTAEAGDRKYSVPAHTPDWPLTYWLEAPEPVGAGRLTGTFFESQFDPFYAGTSPLGTKGLMVCGWIRQVEVPAT